MSERPASPPPWFERRFTFDAPLASFPKAVARLAATPDRLEELTRGLGREELVAKPDGKWSIQENAGHLLDVEPLWSLRVTDLLDGRPVLAAADLTNRTTHEAGHNDRPLAEVLAAFRAARSALVARLAAIPEDGQARSSLHPRLGVPMRLVDHLEFVAEHDDHHLARIASLRS